MSFHYANSYLSVQYPDIDLSAKHLSSFLRELGRDRERVVRFCRSFKITEDCVLFDGTDIFSHSGELALPKFSKSKFGTCDDMINLMCLFSVGQQMPVYYRLLPGNIKDVSAFRLSLLESGVKDAIVIIDKGFASEKNIKALEEEDLRFIIPLPRNSSYIDYGKIKTGDKSLFEGYFRYHGRYIWFYSVQVDEKKRVFLFLDEELRHREETDYLNRIESKAQDYAIEKFHGKRHALGATAIIENTGKMAEEVYCRYKSRGEVEAMTDALKNILDADRTYMQSAHALEGWMFVNLVALKCYNTTLNLLKKHELNRRFSPQDLFLFLSELKKVKINKDWHNTESTKKTAELLKSIGVIPIT
jgi:transposase